MLPAFFGPKLSVEKDGQSRHALGEACQGCAAWVPACRLHVASATWLVLAPCINGRLAAELWSSGEIAYIAGWCPTATFEWPRGYRLVLT